MSLLTYLDRIKIIDRLIYKRTTGNLEALAKKIHLSRAGTHKFLNEMKGAGFPISYSREDKSYYYTKEGKLVNNLFEAEFGYDELKKITGGKKFFDYFQSPLIVDKGDNIFV